MSTVLLFLLVVGVGTITPFSFIYGRTRKLSLPIDGENRVSPLEKSKVIPS